MPAEVLGAREGADTAAEQRARHTGAALRIHPRQFRSGLSSTIAVTVAAVLVLDVLVPVAVLVSVPLSVPLSMPPPHSR